jgi:hypothetical protein
MALATGTRLGPYEIHSALGAGGMGEVYRARDTRLDRSVAVKVLPADIAADPNARVRFEREARAIAALDHPHICSLFDIGDADGTHHLVMPLLEGQTLAARIERGALPLEEALAIGIQVADALDKAHRQGIVHRDLKPGNVMLTKSGAKLLDFGLAKLRPVTGPISMSGMRQLATTTPGTADGVIVGTVPFMAPEQVEGREADARSDIWTLGAVLYEMLTGSRAFSGESAASVIGAILKDPVPPVSARQPLAPAALDRAIATCLAKDPDERWQSARWRCPHGAGPSAHTRLDACPGERCRRRRRNARRAMVVWLAPRRNDGAGGVRRHRAALEHVASGDVGVNPCCAICGLARWRIRRFRGGHTEWADVPLGSRVRNGCHSPTRGHRRRRIPVDTSTGANLWAENYTRPYSPDSVFELQDSLAPIVSTIAEMNGVLAHSMWTTLRERDPETLTPYEAMLRSFGYYESFTPEEYRLALAGLKRAIAQEPNHAGCLTMLAIVYANGYLLHYDAEEKQEDLALMYARRAVAAEPSNPLAYYALSVSHVARKDTAAFLSAAERALALNPLDGAIMGEVALWIPIAATGNAAES